MNIDNLSKDMVVDRTFTIIKKLGGGYTGVVYQAQDERNNRQVALKFLKKADKDYEVKAKRFKEEYQMQLIGKSHPNIAEVYQFGFYEGHFYFASEFISGEDIYTAACGMNAGDVAELFIQMFDGLDFIHRNGLLHLDIKAENVLVKTENGKSIVKLVDFGIAAFTSQKIRQGGTPHYIAPEIALGQTSKIDARADLYSAGVLMYYCLTSTFPFLDRWNADGLQSVAQIIEKESPPEQLTRFISDIPDYLNTITMRLLAREPESRFYPNARAVVNALSLHQPEAFGGVAIRGSYLRPIGNRHIGRGEIQTTLKKGLADLNTPSPRPSEGGIFHITGYFGLGKTHLLETLKEEAAILPESVYVSTVLFPADELAIETWASELQRELSDNCRSILILADDVHNCNPEDKAGVTIQNIIDTIAERKKKPDLYAGIRPVMLVMAGESFENGQNMLREDEKDDERYDWSKIAEKANASIWELKPFSKPELLEYLRATPALKDKDISEKWLEHLMWATSGFPADIAAHLEEKDRGKMLFGLDGSLILPYTIEPNMDEPSMDITSLKWLPLPAKQRLQKQYSKLEPLEREVANLIAVWNHRNVARTITEDDIIGFFYSPTIKQAVCNLQGKNILRCVAERFSVPQDVAQDFSPAKVTFTNPYMQSVVYEQILQMDKEAIHDTIAGYLKNDKDGILLHKGYGSDKQAAVISLVKLAQRRIRERGDLTLAIELLKDAFSQTGGYLSNCIRALLIECYTNAGKYADAEKIFGEAAEISASDVWKAQLYRRYIPALIQQQKFEEAEKAIDAAKGLVKWPTTPAAIIIENYRGRILYERFFTRQGGNKELLEKAKSIFKRTLEDEKKVAEANRGRVQNNELGAVLVAIGELESAIEILEEKLRKYRAEKSVLGEIWTRVAIANARYLEKRYGEAIKVAKEALLQAKDAKQKLWMLTAQNILANIYHDSGRYEDALKEGLKCLALGQMFENTERWNVIKKQIWVQVGYSHKELGSLDKAAGYFEAAVAAGVDGYRCALANIGLCEFNLKNGNIEKAKEYMAEAEKVMKNLPDSMVLPNKDYLKDLKEKLV